MRYDVNIESLRTGHLYGIYFDHSRLVDHPEIALVQCELEYIRTRSVLVTDEADVFDELEQLAQWLEGFLASEGLCTTRGTYSKLFVPPRRCSTDRPSVSVYWMIWDGAAAWIVDELLRRAALPHLARLVGRGATQAALVPSIPNCQTPPGLAALLTGTQPADNGVTGFFLPGDGNGDIAGWRRAFSPDVLTREPIWETAGRHGYTSILVHAPWGFDRDGQTADGVDLAVEAYQTRVARERAAFLGDLPVVWDDLPIVTAVRSAGSGPDQTVELVVGDRAVRLDERWVEVDTGSGSGAYFRVVVHPNGSRAVVRTPVYAPRCAGADADGVRDMRKSIAARTFVGDSMGSLLRDGWFGARLAEGGDGSAERIFLSGAQLVAGSFEAHLRAALERPRPDLLIAYVPMTDDVGHALAGLLTGETDMETREAAWDLVAEGYAMSDRLLGVLMESAQDDDTIVVAADHGIARVTSDLHVNAVLADAGLAVPAREGEAADHLQSSVHYHIVNNGLILRGLGPQTLDGEDTMSRAEAVLRGLRRPETDRPAVLGFVDAHGVPVTLGPGTNQAYLLLGEGVHPDADRAEGQHFGPPSRSASHTTYGGTGAFTRTSPSTALMPTHARREVDT